MKASKANIMLRFAGIGLAVLMAADRAPAAGTKTPVAPAGNVKRLILGEQKIEGKIRRPQLVLIKADQRPEFEPMVMQSFGKKADIVKAVIPSVIQNTPYDKAFEFTNGKISSYVP
jgi:hypothetical protein